MCGPLFLTVAGIGLLSVGTCLGFVTPCRRSLSGVMELRQLPLLRASQFAQSGRFQTIGSRGSPASTIIVHQLTSHGTVGVSS
jgi:hypothetical protein